jgi:hypothetical protein
LFYLSEGYPQGTKRPRAFIYLFLFIYFVKAAPNTKAPTAMFKGLKKNSGAKTISYEFKRLKDIEAKILKSTR